MASKPFRQEANPFDVMIIDSWNKLNAKSSEFDKLRKDFPITIFIVIFQRTTQGTIRGGTVPLFDSGINLELVKVEDTFLNNYAVATKNRYGVTGLRYNLHQQKITNYPIAAIDKNGYRRKPTHTAQYNSQHGAFDLQFC